MKQIKTKKTYCVHSGFSSSKNATKVWTPEQMEERARLINMKKNKKDHRGDTSILMVASGKAINASPAPA